MPAPLIRPSAPRPVWRGWERTLSWEGEPVLLCAVRPLSLPRCPERLARYCRRLEEAWRARWEKVLYPRACAALRAAREGSRPFRPWEASLSAAVPLGTPERLSLTVDTAERLDGPAAAVLRLGETWDLSGRRPVSLGELFPPGFRWRRWVREAAARQLRAGGPGAGRLLPDWERRLSRAFDPERFYLTAGGAAVFFPAGALGPRAEGIRTVSLRLPGLEGGEPSAQV